jgi:hypothetical protein
MLFLDGTMSGAADWAGLAEVYLAPSVMLSGARATQELVVRPNSWASTARPPHVSSAWSRKVSATFAVLRFRIHQPSYQSSGATNYLNGATDGRWSASPRRNGSLDPGDNLTVLERGQPSCMYGSLFAISRKVGFETPSPYYLPVTMHLFLAKRYHRVHAHSPHGGRERRQSRRR